MSNDKLYKIIGLIALFCVLMGTCFFYYRYLHPKYITPPPRPEITLTIIPGWNLRQIAEYLVSKGFATSTKNVYELTGEPVTFYYIDCSKDLRTSPLAKPCPSDFYSMYESHSGFAGKNAGISLEGFLAPETYRVFADAKLSDVINKFLDQGYKDYWVGTSTILSTGIPLGDFLTMASIIEKETKFDEDRPIVSDILWRRVKKGWALQVDSSVHYAIDKTGNVFTTNKERQFDSLWNTYKYPGLPPGPICSPSVESMQASINPKENDYWYFLSGKDGHMHYAKTLEEHNKNKKYLY